MPIGTKGRGNFGTREPNFLNAGVVTLVQYGVYALDLFKANALSVDVDTSHDNVVPVDATNLPGGRLVVAQEPIAAKARGKFVDSGFTTCQVLGPVAYGDYLKGVAAQVYLTKDLTGAISTNTVGQVFGAIGGATTANVDVELFGSAARRNFYGG